MVPQHEQGATWQVYFGNFSAPRPPDQPVRAAYRHWGIPVAEEKGGVDKLHGTESGGRNDGQRGRNSPSLDKIREVLGPGWYFLWEKKVLLRCLQVFCG